MQKTLIKYLALISISVLLSIFIPSIGKFLHTGMKIWLFIILLLSSFDIRSKELKTLKKDSMFIAAASITRLMAIPALVFFATSFFLPEYQIPLTLIVLAPVGVTAGVFTNMLGGRTSLSLALTMVTGFITPIWIPIFINTIIKTSVYIPWQNMVVELLMLLLVPVIISEYIEYKYPKWIPKINKNKNPYINLLVLFILTGSISSQLNFIITIPFTQIIITSAITFILFIILGTIRWVISLYRPTKDEIAVVMSFLLTNFSLSVYIASTFFSHMPLATITSVLAIIPWNISIIVMGNIIPRFHKQPLHKRLLKQILAMNPF